MIVSDVIIYQEMVMASVIFRKQMLENIKVGIRLKYGTCSSNVRIPNSQGLNFIMKSTRMAPSVVLPCLTPTPHQILKLEAKGPEIANSVPKQKKSTCRYCKILSLRILILRNHSNLAF